MEFLAGLYTLLLVAICLLQALLLHRVIKDQTAEQLRDIAHQNSLPRGEKLTLFPKNMLPILSRCIGEVNVIFR